MPGSPILEAFVKRHAAILVFLRNLPRCYPREGPRVYVLTDNNLQHLRRELNSLEQELNELCKNCTARANGEQGNHHKSKDTL